ncbi:MAG: 3-deoxy-D-manno-octulosonic acid kinase [Lysobacterales bacterium CG17_big_fil_post_rev_8_21_14_2_50_64_11]|nr:MAG: 3-deoxy-D-manno-octulosonic acid kinase [Xanthomonadales bacterium CG17_big_fil_post_rev_8_21_14_2_50_64_11]PIX60149.1 MAG: 3-deoxy-D-manno-octulosonic acid kinase [Xanthomonadales bacterium CG_4_10_14_3_um_filter_64_11]
MTLPGGVGIVFDSARLPQAPDIAHLFDLDAWPQITPVLGSGRGAAWFVASGTHLAVLRHYRRGGLFARLLGDWYPWHGAERTRGFAEFNLLAEMADHGLPVPAPLAARYQHDGAGYRADILIERIATAVPWAALLRNDLGNAAWESVGETIARFHRAGIDHADLNVNNILLDGSGQVWLIDFDRSTRRALHRRWRYRNLHRLRRSIDKLLASYHYDDALVSGWSRLRESYALTMAQGLP